jgi:hypothetical protein
MKGVDLAMVGVFTVAAVLTIYFWIDRTRTEGFESSTTDTIRKLQDSIAVPPTDSEANDAYVTLLRYIQANSDKGLKFVFDFGDRFFGLGTPLRPDLDLRTLLDNYMSPLQRK